MTSVQGRLVSCPRSSSLFATNGGDQQATEYQATHFGIGMRVSPSTGSSPGFGKLIRCGGRRVTPQEHHAHRQLSPDQS